MSLLFEGNSKLGRGIRSFNLPIGQTCPGKTQLCEQKCYGKCFRRFPDVANTHATRMVECQQQDFVRRMVQEIQDTGTPVIRMHVTGDFFSAAYVRKWIAIAKACPGVVFYGYTRSWRVPRIRRALFDLQRLPNVELWYSCDQEDTDTPEGRTAYMSVSDDDRPPEHVDMVFRVNRSTPRKTMGGKPVCPHENGTSKASKITCTNCRICFKAASAVTNSRRAAQQS